jgi:two-component system, chemotaxis family, chemotaxis protein CheY
LNSRAAATQGTVLIVDDHPAMRQFIGTLLPKWFNARECDDGAKALAAYKEHKPVCVLMDVAMPQMDGFAAAAEIRTFDPEANIIFMTQFGDAETREAAAQAGASAFLLKENLNELGTVLQQFGASTTTKSL